LLSLQVRIDVQTIHHLKLKQLAVGPLVTFVTKKGAISMIFRDYPTLSSTMRSTLGDTIQNSETCADMPTKSETTAVLLAQVIKCWVEGN
jgi:hypothetical protein